MTMPTVLVIEDEADIRFLIRRVLEANGMGVIEAETGPVAMRRLEEDSLPDLILLDVQMPGMDGWTTLEAIREKPATADLPVVMCTVKGRPEDKIRGVELGCDGYVTKPFDMWELTAQVEAALVRGPIERRRLREAVLEQAREELSAST